MLGEFEQFKDLSVPLCYRQQKQECIYLVVQSVLHFTLKGPNCRELATFPLRTIWSLGQTWLVSSWSNLSSSASILNQKILNYIQKISFRMQNNGNFKNEHEFIPVSILLRSLPWPSTEVKVYLHFSCCNLLFSRVLRYHTVTQ